MLKNISFVLFEVAEALTTTPTCHGRLVAILHLCCTIMAGVEMYFLSIRAKRNLMCCSVKWRALNFLCGYYFLTNTFM
jgi:hypothetical protein